MHDRGDPLATDHLLRDLHRRSARGGLITFSAQFAKILLQFVTVIVLTRLLPASAFGLVAMVAVITAILDLVKEFGLSAATIRAPTITHKEVTALFWINAAAGAAIAAVLAAGAPLVARVYGEPALVGIMRWLAVGFLVSGLFVQQAALLRRQMRFGVIVGIDVAADCVGFLVALGFAASHWGYWSLVAQRLASIAVALIANWSFCHWRPGLPRYTAGIGRLLGFGASMSGVSVSAAVMRNLDQACIGWMWGASALGLYERAAKLLMAPTINIILPVYSVVMPLLSRLDRDNDRYRRGFCRTIEILAMVLMPGAALVALNADWVVGVLFGAKWQGAVPLVTWFAVAAGYQPIAQMMGVLFVTQGRSREMLRAAFVDLVCCIASIALGLRFGPIAVAAALAGIGWLVRFPVAIYLATRRGPVAAYDAVAAVVPGAAAAVATALALFLVRRWLLPLAVPAFAGLAIAMAAAFASTMTALSVLPRSRRTLRYLLRLPRMLRGEASQLAA